MGCKYTIILLMNAFFFGANSKPISGINSKIWGEVDGKEVRIYTLSNSKRLTVEITNYGGIVVSIIAPDRDGKFENIVLGFDNLKQYEKQNSAYLGAIIGRYANRIAKANFIIDNIKYQLSPNDFPNHSHGGIKGFDKHIWDVSEITGADFVGLSLQYLSKDMEEGYPGNLKVKVTYVLSNDNKLKIYYEAKTDKPTVVNLTHHSYFNLSGGSRSILDHKLTIFADQITPTDTDWIPSGKLTLVDGTPFDFRQTQAIGERIKSLSDGYNMNFVLRKADGKKLAKAAEVTDLVSGRLMKVYTTQPGLQLYTADYLDGSIIGSGNTVFSKNMGLAMEAQHFPDSPNRSDFPSTVLRPGETYSQLTVYQFLTPKPKL